MLYHLRTGSIETDVSSTSKLNTVEKAMPGRDHLHALYKYTFIAI